MAAWDSDSSILSIAAHAADSPETDDDSTPFPFIQQQVEPNSVWALVPEVEKYLSAGCCDVDQLVLVNYDLQHLLEDFPGSNFVFTTKTTPHRRLTDEINTAEGVGPWGAGETDLLFGTLDMYQVVGMHMSKKDVDTQPRPTWLNSFPKIRNCMLVMFPPAPPRASAFVRGVQSPSKFF